MRNCSLLGWGEEFLSRRLLHLPLSKIFSWLVAYWVEHANSWQPEQSWINFGRTVWGSSQCRHLCYKYQKNGRAHPLNSAHYILRLGTQACFVLYISHLHQRECLPCSVPRTDASGLLQDSVRQEEFSGFWNANKHFKHLSWLLESLHPAPWSVISFYKKKACAIFHTNHMLF